MPNWCQNRMEGINVLRELVMHVAMFISKYASAEKGGRNQ